jgi:general secretion pathway protein G
MIHRRIRKAFTLVEILIVVVILGILAAIVVPQFSRASEDAQVSNVESQLQTLRGQIELFRVRNNGFFPAANDAGELWTVLLTPPAGQEPYIRNAPVNPRTGTSTVELQTGPATAAAGADAVGWFYNPATGQLWANGYNQDHRTTGNTAGPFFQNAATP